MRRSPPRNLPEDVALLLLRLVLGLTFLAHGSQKLFGWFGGSGIAGFAPYVAKLGFPFPVAFATLSGISEFLGGLLVLVGAATGAGAGMILLTMLVAMVKVTGPRGFFIQNNGWEYNLLIIAVCLALLLSGPGRWAVWRVGGR